MEPDDLLLIRFLASPGLYANSSILRLKLLRKKYPSIVYFEEAPDGRIEMCYDLKQLRQAAKEDRNFFEVRDWERTLKRAGLLLVQKQMSPKKWAVRQPPPPPPPLPIIQQQQQMADFQKEQE